MKFLLNMNVPRELGRRLATKGHERRHLGSLFTRVMGIWPEIEKPLLAGAIVVMEDSAYRVRRLPIAHDS